MVIEGITISPGRARGEARVVAPERLLQNALQATPQASSSWEIERLHAAIGRATVQLERVNRQLAQRIGSDDAAIFHTHAGILRDADFVNQIKAELKEGGLAAEAAVARVAKNVCDQLATNPVPFVRDKAADMLDIARRLIRCLQAAPTDHSEADPDAIIFARELTPTELVRYAHQKVKAIVTGICGRKSHTAILARSLGIPMLTGVQTVIEAIADGAEVFVDATGGRLYVGEDVAPGSLSAADPAAGDLGPIDALTTTDGVHISLLLSISDTAESGMVRELGADGIGLWRTEFLFMDQTHWPTEEDLFEEFRKVASQIGDAELTIRLADFGAEKCPIYADIPLNRNPSLGLRGLRLLLQRDDILGPQLSAVTTMAAERPVTLLLPMVDSVDTLEVAIERFCRLTGHRNRSELPFRLAAMVEMPSAALMAAEFLEHVDSLSLGLNDLTQYTLAADRDDELVEAYHDPMHPAVIRLIKQVVDAAAAASKPLTACGDLAGDIEAMAVLLALGIRRLSVSRVDYPKLARTIRGLSIASLVPLGATVPSLRSPRAVRQYVAEWLHADPQPG
jgi:phosphoenolpyruvate-protein phosphotransferase